ncbi:MAG: zinc ribbon domain-containing protein [Thermodesulfobacteriota bacterium]|nr:zinc ribbon domain-containing protein [Thermodesulfobacteriota bacterium]
MPIYEYKCNKCNNSFEKLIFAGEEENLKCPECGNKDITKKMSATSFMGSSIGTCAANSPKGFS